MPKKNESQMSFRAEKRVKDLLGRISELTEALKRERADAENLRRRHEDQISKLNVMVRSSIVGQLLPVIDNFERALKHVPKDLAGNDYVKGVNGVVKQFEETLKNMGVERIKTVGEHFDPHVHEAVSVEGDGSSLDSEEIVAEELQAGYKIGNDVIRHAVVKVKRNK